jgi:hypothetical protein
MAKPTARSRLLAAISVAQLATGVTGMVVVEALRRRHPYNVLWMQGHADTVTRDSILRCWLDLIPTLSCTTAHMRAPGVAGHQPRGGWPVARPALLGGVQQ